MSFYDIKHEAAFSSRRLFLYMFKEAINDKKHYYRQDILKIINEAILLYKGDKNFYNIDRPKYDYIVYLYYNIKNNDISIPKRIDKNYLTKVYNIFNKEESINIFK